MVIFYGLVLLYNYFCYVLFRSFPELLIFVLALLTTWIILDSKKKRINRQEKKETIQQNSTWSNQSAPQSEKYAPRVTKSDTLGGVGENETYKVLRKYEGDGARVLRNLYLPLANGETTEIDLLMICKKGLFVLESKNYSGWIFGDEKNKNWCQCLSSKMGTQKYFFYNPIWQNQTHIQALKRIVGYNLPFRSVIAFSNRCELKEITCTNEDVRVVQRFDVSWTVYSYYSQMVDTLDGEKINGIYNMLLPYTQVCEKVKKQHRDYVNWRKNQK